MPGMKAIYDRFATKKWDYLCQPAVNWAEEGHVVDSFEHYILAQTVDFYLYTESGREHFTPNGFLPQVGDRWAKPGLALTLKKLAREGPDHFITGEWAKHFVKRANAVGWPIEMKHMSVSPRWDAGTRYPHREFEIIQPSPPQRQAVYCSLVLGILRELEVTSLGHYSDNADALYFFAHALRRAQYETGFINDPEVFNDPSTTLMSTECHRLLADVLRCSTPRIDLTRHVRLTSPPAALEAAGGSSPRQPAGSCESSLVDPQGNWVQMMNTLQSGGIPGEVVDGVPMVGSHVISSLNANIAGWFAGGGRMRSVMSNTMVLRNSRPFLSLGSPGNIDCTVPQILSNILDYGMDPYTAEDMPRMLPLEDDYTVGVESRLPETVVAGMARRGILIKPLSRYDYRMGSYQMSWRTDDGLLHSVAGPRRAGKADAF
jgi:gamma-glutamyltranspeptidase/glutathione hydrolase